MRSISLFSATLLAVLNGAPVAVHAESAERGGNEHAGESAQPSGSEHAGQGMSGSDRMGMSMPRHRYVMRNGIPDEYESKTNALEATQAHLAAGEKLYEQNCASCHGGSGRGDGPAASNLDPQPANIARFSDMPMASDRYLYWTIAEGGEPIGSAMPAFGDALTEEEIWQVITYLQQM